MTWGKPETLWEQTAANLLSPASFFYGLGLYARVLAYANGVIKRSRADVPVISVGNITCGGTGKTPVVIDLVRMLVKAGHRPAVLSRGYKRKSKAPFTIVSDGRGNFASCEESGDEPLLIARAVPSCIVIAGSKRAVTAPLAVEEFGADLIVLDDGFQHVRLERDLDIVLIDYKDDLERDKLLPAGRLREPISALSRAHAIVITKIPQSADKNELSRLKQQIGRFAPESEIGELRFKPTIIRSQNIDEPVSALSGKKVVAFCAIAKPQHFRSTLEDVGAHILDFRVYPDHHWYGPREVAELKDKLISLNADIVLTTAKDFIKFPVPFDLKDRLFMLEIEPEWIQPLSALENYRTRSLSGGRM